MNNPSAYKARISIFSLLVIMSAVFSSCWRPLFDPEISASQVLADRFGSPVISFDIDSIQKYNAQNAWFVPERDDYSVLPRYGLLLRIDDSRLISTFVYFYTTYGYQSGSNDSQNIFGDDSYVDSLPDGSAYASGVCLNSTAHFWTLDSSSLNNSLSAYVPTNDRILGAGNVQSSLAATDTASLCFAYSGTPYYCSVSYSGGTVPPDFSSTSIQLSLPLLNSIKTPGSFFDTGTYLYLSCGLSDGTKAILRWESANPLDEPIRYPAAYGPLVAVLSDGTVLAVDGTTMTVLSTDMKKRFSFPCGAMKFVHERYDSAEGYSICVFTRTTFVRTSSSDSYGKARIELFEIPTSELSNLSS